MIDVMRSHSVRPGRLSVCHANGVWAVSIWVSNEMAALRARGDRHTTCREHSRFQREARAISSLNHPNICQLYDIGPDYLVMELVDGRPIAAVETPRKLLDFAVQMAGAS